MTFELTFLFLLSRYLGIYLSNNRATLCLTFLRTAELFSKVSTSLYKPTSNLSVQFSSVPQLYLTLCDPHGLQHARPPCPSPIPGVYSNSCPLSQWCHPIISSSIIPFFSSYQSFLASGSFHMSQFFTSGGQSIGVSVLASTLPMVFRTDLLQDGLVGSPCSPRGSQESSPTAQFKSINSSALSFPYSPTLTSIHDYWKNHSLD